MNIYIYIYMHDIPNFIQIPMFFEASNMTQNNPVNGAGGFDDTSACGVDVRSSAGCIIQCRSSTCAFVNGHGHSEFSY